MASLKTKFSVGLFLIIGIGVIIIGIIWLGMSNYLEKGRLFAAYFDESVQGLDKDSPVKYRGVSIGRVQSIGVAPDEKLIEVIMKVESKLELQNMQKEVVAQLKSVGITGLMFIELERKSSSEPDLSPKLQFEPPYLVIPTRPSEISKFFKGVEDVFTMFRAIDTESISQQLTDALRKINKSIDDAQVDALVADVRATVNNMKNLLDQEKVEKLLTSVDHTTSNINRMAVNADEGISEIRRTVTGLDDVINQGEDDFKAITSDLRASSLEVRKAMEAAAAMLESTDRQMDVLQRQVLATVNRIDQAGRSLNRILEQVANQPSQVIFGEPAPEKPTPPQR
jgi:phospholipid/cholesterol/gamma-HCH transport system substrate-binding protein